MHQPLLRQGGSELATPDMAGTAPPPPPDGSPEQGNSLEPSKEEPQPLTGPHVGGSYWDRGRLPAPPGVDAPRRDPSGYAPRTPVQPGWFPTGSPNRQTRWESQTWGTTRKKGGARRGKPMRPPPLSTGMRVGYLAATLGLVALLVIGGAVAHKTAVELTTPSSPTASAKGRPSAAQLIVGNPITVPAALFEANPPGSTSLVTPTQATAVATAIWHLWETAQVSGDTRALSQLITPGSLLDSTLYDCVNPVSRCAPETSPRTFSALVPIVPLQTSYPLYFLAEFDTTELVANSQSGINQWVPWVELQILTKTTPANPWMLSFDSGYDDVNPQVTPPFLPFLQGEPRSANGTWLTGTYNLPVTSSAPVAPSQFLPLLADYYQSYKDTQEPPASSPFVANGAASEEGQSLATSPQGSVYAGARNGYTFSVDASAGQWEFSVQGGYPMVCGSVFDTSTQTAVSGLLYQNPDETNYGAPLAPGTYRVITTKTDHETCVYTVAGGLDKAGDTADSSSVTGQQ